MAVAIRTGVSQAHTAKQAVAELSTQLAQPDIAIVLFFCSSHFDLDEMASCLRAAFPEITVIGCTTAGEITPLGYRSGSITGASLGRSVARAESILFRNLSTTGLSSLFDAAGSLSRRMEMAAGPGYGTRTFATLFIDGMSGAEDALLSALHTVMPIIPLFGGSAGDDLAFQQSFVYCDGAFHSDAAVLTLIHTDLPFRVFKTQHFIASEQKMVITGADPVKRIVTEINAEPAGAEYARMIGLDAKELTPMIFANHPVVVRVGGTEYVRSIQKLNDDGSLSFFCAIDEGLVLSVAKSVDPYENLRDMFNRLSTEIGAPQLTLGCECVLRLLDREHMQDIGRMGNLLSAHNVIGFNTYGEQFNAIHVNQTFTGVVLGAPKP